MNQWVSQAIAKIEADFQRSSDTHLHKVDLPAMPNLHLYLKDESTHPTGSLKHRLARSLFLYGLCNGKISEGTTVVEASSGSTAISEAYFARLLDVPFITVVPQGTSQEKIDEITFYGGRCHFVKGAEIYREAERLASELDGHYMDQFTYAERATDWRGNSNIAESIFAQMEREPHPVPDWVVVSAGTGGTSATIGRYIRYKGYSTQLCVADPENSVFYDYFQTGDEATTCEGGSCVEGIGRPRVEPSFVASVVDRMIKVPDAASYATIHFLKKIMNRRCGGSTGTNLFAMFQILSELHAAGREGSVVSMICDAGDRYTHTYYDEGWLAEHGYAEDMERYRVALERFYAGGVLA